MKYAYRKLTSFQRRVYNSKRRARQYKSDGKFSTRTITNLYVKQRGKCAICFEYLFGKFEVDHIKPLSKGGTNNPDNIQLLCPNCNKIKGNKDAG